MRQAAARGRDSYESGVSAENRIAQDYQRRGFSVAGRRWRGDGGEIDLITRDADGVVFVEVKKARDFATADRIRDELFGDGILLEDGPEGTTWRRA